MIDKELVKCDIAKHYFRNSVAFKTKCNLHDQWYDSHHLRQSCKQKLFKTFFS